MDNTLDERRNQVKKAYYYGSSWVKQVDQMSDKQVMAIYLSLRQRERLIWQRVNKRKAQCLAKGDLYGLIRLSAIR